MVKPACFGFNTETAASNHFQKASAEAAQGIQQLALAEFNSLVENLEKKGIETFVFEDTADPVKPDAIFPNNWVTFHRNGTVALYPMAAQNRRSERRSDIIDALKKNFEVKKIIDLSAHEKEGRFLEGSGSIVFDHDYKFSYACISSRTDKELFIEHSIQLGYHPICFHAVDQKGKDIYHTNVMMCITGTLALICADSIKEPAERKFVCETLAATGHEMIELTFEQMNAFAGNMLGLKTPDEKSMIIMSQRASESLSESQKTRIATECEIITVPLPTIENVGGGGVRCMMAEIFLPKKN